MVGCDLPIRFECYFSLFAFTFQFFYDILFPQLDKAPGKGKSEGLARYK
jgi:hypothetical protein